MSKENKNMKILKLILLILFVILMILLTIILFPLFKNLGSQEGRIIFKEKINSLGIFGPLALIGLISLQILIAFLPGEPLEILSGICYGTVFGTILVLISVFISSAIIFFSIKKFGKNFIITFFGKEEYEKMINSKLFKDTKKIEILLFILYFIPGTPKDFLTYIGGLIPIKPAVFLLISTFARFPSIITSTFAGANITDGNYAITLLTFGITLLISLIGIFIYNKFEKKQAR